MLHVCLTRFLFATYRKRNERFFLSGKMLVNLIDHSTKTVAKVIAKTRSSRRNAHTRALEYAAAEAQALRQTLVTCFAGERLRRTFDWALSSGGDDDVSHYLSKLTELEQGLFYRGSSAVAAHEEWMVFGNRHLGSNSNSKGFATPGPSSNPRAVTPGDQEDPAAGETDGPSNKRRRLDQ